MKFTSFDPNIIITQMHIWDDNGTQDIDVQISAPAIEARLMNLEIKLNDIETEMTQEKMLIEKHPVLQDAWEQYQTIKKLVK